MKKKIDPNSRGFQGQCPKWVLPVGLLIMSISFIIGMLVMFGGS